MPLTLGKHYIRYTHSASGQWRIVLKKKKEEALKGLAERNVEEETSVM